MKLETILLFCILVIVIIILCLDLRFYYDEEGTGTENTELRFFAMDQTPLDSVTISIGNGSPSMVNGSILDNPVNLDNQLITLVRRGYDSLFLFLQNSAQLRSMSVYFEKTDKTSSDNKFLQVNSLIRQSVGSYLITEMGSSDNTPTQPAARFQDETVFVNQYQLGERDSTRLRIGDQNRILIHLKKIKDSMRVDIVLDNAVDMHGGTNQPATHGGN